MALGCSGFQAELGVVVLEEAERSPTKQRLRRCGNGETKVASRALIFCFFCIKTKEKYLNKDFSPYFFTAPFDTPPPRRRTTQGASSKQKARWAHQGGKVTILFFTTGLICKKTSKTNAIDLIHQFTIFEILFSTIGSLSSIIIG